MNILFVTIAWPENNNSNLYTDLIQEIISKKNTVHVLTGRQKRVGNKISFEDQSELKVLRVPIGNLTKVGALEKAKTLSTLNYKFKAAYKRYLSDNNYDIILFNTPPITLAPFLLYLKNINNAKLHLLLKDIWPYGFVDFNTITNKGIIYSYLRYCEKKLYKASDKIGCMSLAGKKFLISEHPYLSMDKIEVWPNAIKVNKNLIERDESSLIEFRNKFGIPEDSTVFIFSGNIGLGHGVDFLVATIKELRTYKKAYFLVGGAGTHFQRAKEQLEKEKLPNVFCYSYLPQEDFENLMKITDVGIILLDSKYTYPQFPSRLLNYLKNELAVLCAVNAQTDIGEIVETAKCGLSSIHGDTNQFKENIKYLSDNKDELKEMKENSNKLLLDKYDVKFLVDKVLR